jgi:hypothetical protein
VLDHDLPLPRGFAGARLPPGNEHDAQLTATGLHITRAIPPGPWTLNVAFELPARAGKVAWSMDLPYGSWKSDVRVGDDPGVTLKPPPGSGATERVDDGYRELPEITIMPNRALELAIALPRVAPKRAATEHACARLAPNRSPWHGKPAPALAARQLDGHTLRLSALRGKVAIVTFTASWVSIAKREPSQLAALSKAVRGVVPVLVFSDADADEVRRSIDPAAPYRVALDPPIGGHDIGPITRAWGTKLVPETYLVDRKGIVRYYFANVRDWSSPDARACLRALATED